MLQIFTSKYEYINRADGFIERVEWLLASVDFTPRLSSGILVLIARDFLVLFESQDLTARPGSNIESGCNESLLTRDVIRSVTDGFYLDLPNPDIRPVPCSKSVGYPCLRPTVPMTWLELDRMSDFATIFKAASPLHPRDLVGPPVVMNFN